MFMGPGVFVLLGFSALAVDISLITMAEQQAQATADAASHAALVAYRSSASPAAGLTAGNAAANYIINRNQVGTGQADLTPGFPKYRIYDHATGNFLPPSGTTGINAVEVQIDRLDTNANAQQTLLASMFGVNSVDIDARGVTAHQMRAIMLVQDFSCSMNGSNMQASRTATTGFFAYLQNFQQPGDMFGITGYADQGVDNVGYGTLVRTDDPWLPLMLTTPANWSLIQSKINGICSRDNMKDIAGVTTISPGNVCNWNNAYVGPDPDSSTGSLGVCTNPSIGMQMAIDELANKGKTHKTYFRGMVVFSDGLFNTTNSKPQCGASPADATDEAIIAADEAFTLHDINIWTVLLDTGGSINISQMEALERGIGDTYETNAAADLPAIYRTIAEQIPTTLVF